MKLRQLARCDGCGARLSRYNLDTRCGPCQRAGWLPRTLWDRPDLRQALENWDFGRVLGIIQQVTGASQHDISGRLGLSQGMVSRLLSGHHRLRTSKRSANFFRA